MAAKIDLTTKKRFLEIPERKRFGWSPYMQEILKIQFPRNAVKVMAQKSVIRGKKLCLFGKFIWDYQIEVVDYKEFVRE